MSRSRMIYLVTMAGFLALACAITEAQSLEKPSASAILDTIQKGVTTESLKNLFAAVTREDALVLVPEFIEAKKSDVAAQRNAARVALEQLRNKLIHDEGALIKLLASKDTEIVFFAKNTLVYIGTKANQSLINTILSSSEDSLVRRWASYALSDIGDLSDDQVATLIGILESPSEDDDDLKFWLAVTLANQGSKSDTICSALYQHTNNANSYYRSNAAISLEKMGVLNKPFSEGLFAILLKENSTYPDALIKYEKRMAEIRNREANAEVTYQEEEFDRQIVNNLRERAHVRAALLRIVASHGSHPDDLMKMAIQNIREPPVYITYVEKIDFCDRSDPALYILPAFKSFGTPAVSPLLEIYKSNPEPKLLSNVIDALGNLGEPSKPALPILLRTLGDSGQTWNMRAQVIRALGRIGSSAPQLIIPRLISVHKSRVLNLDVAAGQALESIAERLALTDRTEFIGLLKEAQTELDSNDKEPVKKSAEGVRLAIKTLTGVWWRELFQGRIFAYGKYVSPFALLFLFWLALYFWRPAYLFRINQKLSKVPVDYKVFGVLGAPLRYALLVGFFHYRPRVLDAWLKAHIETARTRFSNRHTVREREHHVPTPVDLDGTKITNFSPADLKPLFSATTACLMVEGEGGTGKTSLACLVAKWAMDYDVDRRLCKHALLPILIEQDSEAPSDGSVNIVERAIQLQLKSYTQEAEFPTSELISNLLKSKRLLIIIDGFSEIDAPTRGKIMADLTKLPVNALVFTSRESEYLEDYAPAVIKPLKIGGSFLSDFLGAYFSEQGVRNQFDDEEFFDVCRRMSLLSNNRDVTILLVKLFADLVVASKLKITKDHLPQHVPDLVLYYLNYLNRDFDNSETSNESVHESAKAVAWLCLKETFHPTPALTMEVMNELGRDEKATRHLDHLENKLNLVRRVGVGRERIRFSLEPLAEYLASMHISESLGQNSSEWKELLSTLKNAEPHAEDRTGFINALQDCCLTKYSKHVPSFVLNDLGELSGRGLADIKKENTQRRVRQIVHDLELLDLEGLSIVSREVSLQHKSLST